MHTTWFGDLTQHNAWNIAVHTCRRTVTRLQVQKLTICTPSWLETSLQTHDTPRRERGARKAGARGELQPASGVPAAHRDPTTAHRKPVITSHTHGERAGEDSAKKEKTLKLPRGHAHVKESGGQCSRKGPAEDSSADFTGGFVCTPADMASPCGAGGAAVASDVHVYRSKGGMRGPQYGTLASIFRASRAVKLMFLYSRPDGRVGASWAPQWRRFRIEYGR
ncbi:hypothetical protein MRX96_041735 [Rhipicephalus microplus]